jgi:hypothetical protein
MRRRLLVSVALLAGLIGALSLITPATGATGIITTDHVRSRVLWLDHRVYAFPCSRHSYPGMRVYRWGCAGRNNIYLFAHASGPFHRLHDLYAAHRLRRGMTVTYRNAYGTVRTYAIAWWRVVRPTNGAFAYAALARPSMTLQTCVGPGGRYRLVVRLTLLRYGP